MLIVEFNHKPVTDSRLPEIVASGRDRARFRRDAQRSCATARKKSCGTHRQGPLPGSEELAKGGDKRR